MLSVLFQNDLSPKPIRTNFNDGTIFAKDGKMKESFVKLCKELGLDPKEFVYRKVDEFGGEGIKEHIKILRYNHYENKRIAKLKALKAIAKERNGDKLGEKPIMDLRLNNDQFNLPKLGPLSQKNVRLVDGNNQDRSKISSGIGTIQQLSESSGTQFYTPNINNINKLNTSFQVVPATITIANNNNNNNPIRESRGGVTNIEIMTDAGNNNGLFIGSFDQGVFSLEDNFNRYINNKVKENERLMYARKKAEEFVLMKERNTLSKLRTREDKFVREKKSREESLKMEKMKKEEQNIVKKNISLDLKLLEEKNRETKHKEILEKLLRSSRNREEEIKLKKDKIIKQNKESKLRSDSFSQDRLRNEDLLITTSLSRIEDKFNRSTKYYEENLRKKREIATQYGTNVILKNLKHKEEMEKQANTTFQEFFERHISKFSPRRFTKNMMNSSIDIGSLSSRSLKNKHFLSVNDNRQKQERIKLERIEDKVKQKAKKSDIFRERKNDIMKMYAELKREEKNLRFEDIRENSMLLYASNEKKISEKINRVNQQHDKIKDFRDNREKILEKMRLSRINNNNLSSIFG